MDDKYVGKRLDGRYEIHQLIGVGGMAYVYKAYDRIEGRWVAIKILKEEFSNNSDFLRRFRNEAKAITLLSHPNIVEVFDVSFGDRIQYIVMEFVDGITLKEYIEQEGAIRWNEAVHFTVQILRALEHAHSKGIIHRDIKPQNILLLQNGVVKVGDFGIARFLQSETQTMTDKAIGSVHYIAPEQARGDYITDKVDIYSLGVMLYEMITGKLPFEADNAVSVALMQLQANPVMPREINPSVPRGLEQITMHAMEKNPIDRFQSAGEMLDDLERFRRDPNTIFRYDASASIPYDRSRNERYAQGRSGNRYAREEYDDSYEYEEELVRSRRSAKGAMVVKGIVAAIIIVLLAVGGVWLVNNWEKLTTRPVDEPIEMPQLEGMLYQDLLANPEYTENFVFKTTEGNDPDKASGEILRQNPKAGIMVKKGREVELTINGTILQVEVPDLANYSQADAIDVLKSYNLNCRSENVADDEIEVGKVVTTDPAPKTMVDEGTVVTLKVSKGPAQQKVQVPNNLVGKLVYDVTAALEDAKLQVGGITYDDNSTQPKDTVLSTNPASGSTVSEGSTVDIVVSSGKGAVKQLSYSVPLPVGVDRDIRLSVYRNGTLVEENTVNPIYNSVYALEFSGSSGSDAVVVELDGQMYVEVKFDYDAASVDPGAIYTYTPPEDNNVDNGGGDDGDSGDVGEGDNGSEGSGDEDTDPYEPVG